MQPLIRLAQERDIPEIIALWRECFTNDKEYLNHVFTSLFYNSEVYILVNDNITIASLFLIPIEHINEAKGYLSTHGKYLYGVCTLKEYQNRGYSKLLFKAVLNIIEAANKNGNNKEQIDFIITRPASPSLFNFYKEQGFTINVPRGTINIDDIVERNNINTETISIEIYNRIKCNQQNRFIWSTELLKYMYEIGEFSNTYSENFSEISGSIIESKNDNKKYALLMEIGNKKQCREYEKAYFEYTME